MKTHSLNSGLEKLANLREKFRSTIETGFEHRAKNCLTCDVKGSCCTDEHFVNVHISRLEATAIAKSLLELSPELRRRVIDRNYKAVESLEVSDAEDLFSKSYSCPLFEKDIGCLVHNTAKPAPCINHACYEDKSDLPPSELLTVVESEIGRLNDRVFKKNWNWLPIPKWLERVL